MSDDTPGSKLDIDWSNTLAGALAAVSSAVLLSTLGAAGTLIGAAVGSLAATIGTALYAQGLAKSREKVAQAQETALNKVGVAQAEVRRARRRGSSGATAETHLEQAEEQLAEAEAELGDALDGGRDHGDNHGDQVLEGFPDDDIKPAWRERLAVLPWTDRAVRGRHLRGGAARDRGLRAHLRPQRVVLHRRQRPGQQLDVHRRRQRQRQTGAGPGPADAGAGPFRLHHAQRRTHRWAHRNTYRVPLGGSKRDPVGGALGDGYVNPDPVADAAGHPSGLTDGLPPAPEFSAAR
jgi:hypothetical protein